MPHGLWLWEPLQQTAIDFSSGTLVRYDVRLRRSEPNIQESKLTKKEMSIMETYSGIHHKMEFVGFSTEKPMLREANHLMNLHSFR